MLTFLYYYINRFLKLFYANSAYYRSEQFLLIVTAVIHQMMEKNEYFWEYTRSAKDKCTFGIICILSVNWVLIQTQRVQINGVIGGCNLFLVKCPPQTSLYSLQRHGNADGMTVV